MFMHSSLLKIVLLLYQTVNTVYIYHALEYYWNSKTSPRSLFSSEFWVKSSKTNHFIVIFYVVCSYNQPVFYVCSQISHVWVFSTGWNTSASSRARPETKNINETPINKVKMWCELIEKVIIIHPIRPTRHQIKFTADTEVQKYFVGLNSVQNVLTSFWNAIISKLPDSWRGQKCERRTVQR